MPKVNRETPVTGFNPIVDSSIPIVPPRRPLKILPLEMAPITVIPKIATQKISVGPNIRATWDNGGERKRRARNPATLPNAQPMAARFRERWGSPFLAMG